MISKKEVKHIAKLARLSLNKREILKMQQELSKILDYIEKLRKVDVSGVKPAPYSIQVENIMRNDEVKTVDPTIKKKILEQAPETKDGFVKVKSIIDKPWS
ncbi:Asp-tRNA(Asn)/Glu-tRNA(Gln) amidotransferase subunit GatC [bacterium]|nr:Asp-tRNA(Asn)/Glu-tRNA(Gln) amidotransferase subunit GatC [bacterium]